MRLRQRLQVQLALHGLVPERVDAEHRARRVENTRHDLLAEQRRAGADAEVDCAVLGDAHLDAPVLGHAPLGDIEPRHDLEARGELDRQLHRRIGDFFQVAVEAQTDAVRLLVGLEMDVGRAFLDRVQQHLVDELDDRRVLDLVASDHFLVEVLIAAGDVEVLEIQVVLAQRGHLRVDLFHRFAGDLLQLVFFDDDCLDRQPRLELDLVQRVQIGRIRNGDEQALAAPDQWQQAVLGEQFVGDELDGIDVQVDRIEVQQRYAKLLRRGDGDLARVRQVVRDQVRHQVVVRFLRAAHGLHHRLLVDEAILDEAQRQALQGLALRVDGGYYVVSHGFPRVSRAMRRY